MNDAIYFLPFSSESGKLSSNKCDFAVWFSRMASRSAVHVCCTCGNMVFRKLCTLQHLWVGSVFACDVHWQLISERGLIGEDFVGLFSSWFCYCWYLCAVLAITQLAFGKMELMWCLPPVCWMKLEALYQLVPSGTSMLVIIYCVTRDWISLELICLFRDLSRALFLCSWFLSTNVFSSDPYLLS